MTVCRRDDPGSRSLVIGRHVVLTPLASGIPVERARLSGTMIAPSQSPPCAEASATNAVMAVLVTAIHV
jgi:hypothetical protein